MCGEVGARRRRFVSMPAGHVAVVTNVGVGRHFLSVADVFLGHVRLRHHPVPRVQMAFREQWQYLIHLLLLEHLPKQKSTKNFHIIFIECPEKYLIPRWEGEGAGRQFSRAIFLLGEKRVLKNRNLVTSAENEIFPSNAKSPGTSMRNECGT